MWCILVSVLLLGVLRAPVLAYPPYARGKDYAWVLNSTDANNGISYLGSHTRLRMAVDKMKDGKLMKVATLGGSITAGQGAVDAPNWPQYLFNWLEDTYGKEVVKGSNGAVGGTVSGYMSVCHNMHVPKDVDIVLVEYSVNDWHSPAPTFQNNIRRGYERLLRKLLKYPNNPAVILVHTYVWSQAYPFAGSFWSNAEREFHEFALYYHLPSLSLKACCYQKMVAGEPGFQPHPVRNTNQDGLKYKAFYWDNIHPDGATGARVIAELVMNLVRRTYAELDVQPLTEEEAASPSLKLPAPMIPGNVESISDKCFIGNFFTETVKEKPKGWEWINESLTERPKWGYVSTVVGSILKMVIDTRATASQSNGKDSEVLVELAYLKSYEKMGKAEVKCGGDCSCKASVIDGHHGIRNSQLHLHNFYVTQGSNCIITLKVLAESSSGHNKVKVAGLMISEESGEHEGIRNHMAVEYVHDISQRSKDGTFEVNNHAR
ncbi:hypothetical protein CEUSTIGMA_g5252.t1 [Chlamydomonas eustigma]|uniref:SGNH hydrolase-type esterase domain-containing protein n=1 Tax=Chlamydomonas eustigma TaxID=1157962 RepID=A0A250X4G6_9CHLO|nr:hypothetical protein CEUSTIGMA_g5252.t1 [Chlamydomonas eustigma]|eukprot:GAX77809.1 hypothetical protein CEUSTIGMA_g5252.t1 [Chlamydomonas eustigma]